MIRIESIRDLFTFPRIAFQAVTALGRADAMGLLPADELIDTLDFPSFRKALRHIHRASIGNNIQLDLTDAASKWPENLVHALDLLNLALEESPVPEFEWSRMLDVLGPDLLSRLLHISAISIRRYKAGARATPDEVAGRLHFLCLIVADLNGAYNEFGIRQWFERKRERLDGHSPLDFLAPGWKPANPGPQTVANMARALVTSPVT